MARPTNDLIGRLRALDAAAGHAARLPDVPAPRVALLKAIQAWVGATCGWGTVLPREETRDASAIDHEAKALRTFIEQDRRARQPYGVHQNTHADGSGVPTPADWPHYE